MDETEIEIFEPLEGTQKASGTITAAGIKKIKPASGGDEFPILEFKVGGITGAIRDVLGNASLSVGFACNRTTRKSRLGRLAQALYNWDGESKIKPNDFLGCKVEFLVEPQETEKGEYWNINRDSFGPIGHLGNVKISEPDSEPVVPVEQ